MQALITERLTIQQLTENDAAFILELLNEPGWLQFIGNRNVNDLKDAEDFITNGPMLSYQKLGFGMYKVSLTESGEAIGLCGLLKRDFLEVPDLGYAMLQRYEGQGYAREAAVAVIKYACEHNMPCLKAFTSVDNHRSVALLDALGFNEELGFVHPDSGENVRLFGWQASS